MPQIRCERRRPRSLVPIDRDDQSTYPIGQAQVPVQGNQAPFHPQSCAGNGVGAEGIGSNDISDNISKQHFIPEQIASRTVDSPGLQR